MTIAGLHADAAGACLPTPSTYGVLESGASWKDARKVLILVHGRDRDPAELPGMTAELALRERVRVLAPFAPSWCWYSSRYDAPLQENEKGRETGLQQIKSLLALAQEQGFRWGDIVLAGFSQGGCMVAEYLLAGEALPGAAAIFTGSALAVESRDFPAANLGGMPVVLSGGYRDPWLPVADLMATARALEAAGANVHLEIFPDAEHAVRAQEIELLGDLLVRGAA